MNKELIKASWIRAYRSFLQALVTQIPAGFIVTPAMIQYFKVSYIYVILAVIANAGLYAFASFVTCMVGGLPEVDICHEMTEEEAFDLIDNNEEIEEELEEYEEADDDE